MTGKDVNKGCPYGGLAAWSHVTGDHKGRLYGKRGRGGMMLLEGEGRFPNRPSGEVGRTVECDEWPRGTPLRGDREVGMDSRRRGNNGGGEEYP